MGGGGGGGGGGTGEQSLIVLGMLMPVASLGSLCTGCTGA